MKEAKRGKPFGTIRAIAWWVSDKHEAHKRKKRAKLGSDAIDNLERLYRLKERGAISKADFEELKDKLKERI